MKRACLPRIILTIAALFLLSGTLPLIDLFGVSSSEDAIITGFVYDSVTFEPISGVDITLEEKINGTLINDTETNHEGFFQFTNVSDGIYYVHYQALGYHPNSDELVIEEGETKHLDVILVEYLHDTDNDGIPDSDEYPQDEGDIALSASYSNLCFQTFVIIFIALIISIIMYSKIKQEKLLNNAIRNRIFEYVKENPGMHYRAILKDLDLPMGVLSYHINRLERAQFLTSRQDGMYRRFYIAGPKAEMSFVLSDIQKSILNVIRDNRGISQAKIAKEVGVSRMVVNYHVNILSKAGFIMVRLKGRESACYLKNPSAVAV